MFSLQNKKDKVIELINRLLSYYSPIDANYEEMTLAFSIKDILYEFELSDKHLKVSISSNNAFRSINETIDITTVEFATLLLKFNQVTDEFKTNLFEEACRLPQPTDKFDELMDDSGRTETA